MTTLTKAQSISLFFTPSISGCISSFASITLIVSIFRSNLKLSNVYRRLIFFLSVFDIILSITHALSSLPMPAGTIWGAIGNDVTCGMQGFFTTVGLCGTVLYSLSLTVYFLLVVKYDMSEARIKKCVEPFLHAIPLLYSFGVSTYIYATNNYNAEGRICWIETKPPNCKNDPEVECLSSGNPVVLEWIGGALPLFGVFLANCTILAVIWWSYRSQVRINQSYASAFAQPNTAPQAIQSDEEEQAGSCCLFFLTKQCPIIRNCKNSQSNISHQRRTSVLAEYLSRPSRASARRLEEIVNRAAAYVAAYLFSFMFSLIYRVVSAHVSGPTPFIIILLARFFFPLQGFFNVLVYTYPHVVSYRRNNTECNWFKAFWNVIKSGGDNDQIKTGRRAMRRASIRKRQRVLEQSEYRQRNGVEGIMNSSGIGERGINNDATNSS